MSDTTVEETIPGGDPVLQREVALPPRLTDSLAGRLLRIVFACYFAVTLLVTGLQLALEYRDADRTLMHDVEAMQPTFSPGIADAVWAFNGNVLHGILTGMKALPIVSGIKIVDEHGKLLLALGTIRNEAGALVEVDAEGHGVPVGDRSEMWDDIFSRDFDLVHSDASDAPQSIGHWTVYSNRRIVFDKVVRHCVSILINALIGMLVLWLVLAIVIHRIVGRPLRQLSAFVAQLNIDNLGAKPFILRDHGQHELHFLAGTLNLMTNKLRRSVEENMCLLRDLQDMNSTLQSKVAERTSELEVLARTDLLTGLFNRRKLDEVLNYEGHRIARYGGRLSIVIGDIDKFKTVNDLFGHQVGDLVIAGFAAVLREAIRVVDTVGRWGGEEFMLICPETDLAAAVALAEAIRRRVESTQLPVAGFKTCSFGVAQLQVGETVESLVARADAALYRAKQGGRNRVETDPPL